jgi:hypothetical protein
VTGADLEGRYAMTCIGRISSVRAQYYAISLQRKTQHPGVAAICTGGCDKLFVESKQKHNADSPNGGLRSRGR